MKRRLAIIALVASSLVASTNSASANAQSEYQLAVQQYQIALSNWNLAMKAEQENFKTAMTNWNAAVKAAEQERKEIATQFKSDADEIILRTSVAVASASTARAKKAAGAAGKIEMDSAIALRNAAMKAVVNPGLPPVKPKFSPAPTPPAKPAKVAKENKPSKKPTVSKSPSA